MTAAADPTPTPAAASIDPDDLDGFTVVDADALYGFDTDDGFLDHGLTAEAHNQLSEQLGRPITDDPIRRRRPRRPYYPADDSHESTTLQDEDR